MLRLSTRRIKPTICLVKFPEDDQLPGALAGFLTSRAVERRNVREERSLTVAARYSQIGPRNR